MMCNVYKYIFYSSALFFLAYTQFVFIANAQGSGALLYLDPPAAVVTIGDTFTVDVLLDTDGQTINAAEGAVSFRETDLTLLSMDAGGSIFASWIDPPAYEAGSGRITFSGTTPRTGYRGERGFVVRLTFRALRNTASQVWFSQGAAVLSADGRANNILNQLRSGTYTLTSREVVPSLAQVGSALAPAREELRAGAGPLRSSSHPTQEGWYGTSSSFLYWSLPEGVSAVRTGISAQADTLPDILHEPPVSDFVYHGLPEGVMYAALQFRTGERWGEVFRYRLNTDISAPESLTASIVAREDATDPNVSFIIAASDSVSGVASFSVTINGGRPQTFPADATLIALTMPGPGTHMVRISAYDSAGNSTSTTHAVLVESLPTPLLHTPAGTVPVGSPIVVSGTSDPYQQIELSMQFLGGAPIIKTTTADASGVFSANLIEQARAGTYEIIAHAVDERGGASIPTAPLIITAVEPTFLLFGSVAISYLSIVAALIGFVFVLVLMLWLLVLLVRAMRRRVSVETSEATEAVHNAFEHIKQDAHALVQTIIHASHNRPLTREEELVIATMQEHLAKEEEHLTREIHDIDEVAHPLRTKRLPITRLR